MSYYKTCPYCGAHLDPGELCDCAARIAEDAMLKDVFSAIKKSVPGDTNTEDGNVQRKLVSNHIYYNAKGERCQGNGVKFPGDVQRWRGER